MKTTQEMIEVMQAHIRGEQIEIRGLADGSQWSERNTPRWNWEVCDYRVKPKPREFILAQYTDGEIRVTPSDYPGFAKLIRVREICDSN